MADDHEHHHHEHHDHHHEHDHHEHDDGPWTEEDYVGAVEAFRSEKDEFFRDEPSSPIPEDQRAAFEGLPYYPVDPSLRFEGLALEPYAGNEPTAFQIPTSDGRLRPARRAGTLGFELAGEPRTLTGYTFEDGHSHSIFVPFLDATSGKETYGAGRYLDIEPEEDGTYTLDFNLAYHPSCVYDVKYSCPLTPAENRLPLPIEAGERLPVD
jgi:uncharacterized protein (DUF1684 family)